MKNTRSALLATGLLALGAPLAAQANDFPTVDRVLYVQECVSTHPGPNYEMVNKCSCALDALAAKVKFADYVEMSTAAKANSIGGERGGYIRDVQVLQDDIKRFRGLQSAVEKSCFLPPAVQR
jgi:hypothetical protein